ncbi:MAG: hypothetical protein AAFP69_14180, partial [Planctomycetota bacterium]
LATFLKESRQLRRLNEQLSEIQVDYQRVSRRQATFLAVRIGWFVLGKCKPRHQHANQEHIRQPTPSKAQLNWHCIA